MTEQTQPTDAELLPCPFCGTQPDECDIGQFVVECPSCAIVGPASDNSNAARRAWNTRWGTPAGVGEPYGYVYTAQVAPIVGDERKVERTVFTRNKPPCNALALYTTPQPTQAQAGAVPLTVQYPEGYGNPLAKIAYDAGWRAAEHAHGIKGADHGS